LREAIVLADRIVFLSEAPMHIIKEVVVPLPRSERRDETVIEAFRRQLMDEAS
jgi:ABC-type nitrate/sulfonate/bicarbonate transport system ATPase subunit